MFEKNKFLILRIYFFLSLVPVIIFHIITYTILGAFQFDLQLLQEHSIAFFSVIFSICLLIIGILLYRNIFYNHEKVKEKFPFNFIFKDIPPFKQIKELEFQNLFKLYNFTLALVQSTFVFGMVASLMIENYSAFTITTGAGLIGYLFMYPNFDKAPETQAEF